MTATFDFSNKKILVTGASQGIGYEIALALSRCKARVFAIARNEGLLDKLVSEGENITKIICDVTDHDKLPSVLSEFQPFDGLVNNAGIAVLEHVGEIQASSIDRTMAVNFQAPLLLSQLISQHMIRSNIKGSIVNVSSQASLKPIAQHAVYCSSKAALDMATRCLAKELGIHGIRVNSVNPTVVMTDMGKKNWSDPAKASTLLCNMSLQKFAEPQDVVNAVLFLLSEASSMTTGAILPVDGGFSTQ